MQSHLILPKSCADMMSGSGTAWGWLVLKNDPRERLHVVSGFSLAEESNRTNLSPWLKTHYSDRLPQTPFGGVWYRADAELHHLGRYARRRDSVLTTEAFKPYVNGFRSPPVEAQMVVITYCPNQDVLPWMAWYLDRDAATPITLEIIDEVPDLLAPLDGAWPRSALADSLVTVVGLGSIGTAAAEALAEYAVRRFALIDHDRLRMHNFARHRVATTEVGRLKITAVKDMLIYRDPELKVETFPIDVIDDADVMRPLLERTSIVVGCTDGVASRRVINHLASRAGCPAVLACVLDDGRLGEVIRVLPGRTACLLCSREALTADGVISPEGGIDLGYGTGTRHRPMTAVGGDLDLVGKLAAKVAVATLLEKAGFREQRLPGDQAVIGLRPRVDGEPPPFDAERAGKVVWHDIGAPHADCPTCETA